MEKRIAALPGNDRARARREALRAEREAKERELEAALTSGALARLSQGEKRRLRESIALSQTYRPLRELPKHYYLMEVALLRRALLVLDGCVGLDKGIFFLRPEELPEVAAGREFRGDVADRRRARRIARSVPLPDVLWSDALDKLGRLPDADHASLQGMSVSGGVAEGIARIVLDPSEAPALTEDDILVAPSTDPGWTPLFAQVRGLVLECGGLLSHGAVVAREMGLPAVANIPLATQVLRDGDRIRVDANRGLVEILPRG